MTCEEILKLEPGPKLDRLVAERVMGWKLGVDADTRIDSKWVWRSGKRWSPSRDIAAAMDVISKLLESGLFLDIYSPREAEAPDWFHGDDEWVVFVCDWDHEDGIAHAGAGTLPLAICRAALLAVMEASDE